MLMEEDLPLGGGHTMKYRDDVSYNCTLEMCIILLVSATPIHVIKNNTQKVIFLNTNKRYPGQSGGIELCALLFGVVISILNQDWGFVPWLRVSCATGGPDSRSRLL